LVAARSDGRCSARVALRRERLAIRSRGRADRVCRVAPAGEGTPIDANIAAAHVDADVGSALLARRFVVVGGGSDAWPTASAQRQP